MYPDPIIFVAAPPGAGPLLIRLEPQGANHGLLLYRSPRNIEPHETEAFYSRTLDIHIRTVHLRPEQHLIVDPDTTPGHYCAMARQTKGLFSIPFTFERLSEACSLPADTVVLRSSCDHPSGLDLTPPEFIFASGDSKAEFAISTLAAGLKTRFGGHHGESQKEHG